MIHAIRGKCLMKAPQPSARGAFSFSRAPMTPHQLIALHAAAVKRLARSVGRGYADPDDLMQEGYVALLEAQFPALAEPQQHAYVERRLRGAMIDSIRAADRCTRATREQMKRIERAEQALAGRLGRRPLHAEIAAEADIPLEAYFAARQAFSAAFLASLEEEEHDERDERTDVDRERAALFCASASDDPLHGVLSEERARQVRAAVAKLPDAYRAILLAHFFDERTQEDIAHERGVTASRICQMLKHAFGVLREALEDATC